MGGTVCLFLQLTDLMALLAENFIFNYLGISMFVFLKHSFEPFVIFGSLVAIALGRAFTIYPVAFLLNLGRSRPIPFDVRPLIFDFLLNFDCRTCPKCVQFANQANTTLII